MLGYNDQITILMQFSYSECNIVIGYVQPNSK